MPALDTAPPRPSCEATCRPRNPAEEDYGADTLGRDILGLIDALGERGAVVVIGNHWGAVAAYSAVGLNPTASACS